MSLQVDKADAAASPSNCTKCDLPDSAENMVACDGCGSWYHYSCAEVDESVAELPWKCESCGIMNQTPIPTKTRPKKGAQRLVIPGGAEKQPKSSGGSKTGSRRGKKSAVGDNVSATSSAKARLALELEMIDEQDRMREEELQAELEMKNKKLMLERQTRDRELE